MVANSVVSLDWPTVEGTEPRLAALVQWVVCGHSWGAAITHCYFGGGAVAGVFDSGSTRPNLNVMVIVYGA
jgi:hypothetical protein